MHLSRPQLSHLIMLTAAQQRGLGRASQSCRTLVGYSFSTQLTTEAGDVVMLAVPFVSHQGTDLLQV